MRFILLAALALVTAAPALARPFDEVVASGTIRIALYSENKPFSDVKDGKRFGIDVDLAEAIARQLKLKLDLRLVDAGENVDGDFRLNLWRGDLAGSALADLMLHVPHDKLLAVRNEQIFLTSPYFDQRLAFAWRRGAIEGFQGLRDIEGQSVAVEGTSASDAMLLMAEGGRYRMNLKHFRNFDEAARGFLAGEAPILAGTRAAIEAALHEAGVSREEYPIVTFAVPGLVKTNWDLGGAVRVDSRDLGYAVGEAITALTTSGEMKAICDKYGVTFTAPQGY